jgi:hypothetical protein
MRIKLALYGDRWKNVKPGDFVQKVGWYGDVWAEVLSVYDSPGYRRISYAWADNRSGTDSVFESLPGSWTRYYQVANVCTLKKLMSLRPRIIHTKDFAYGYSSAEAQRKDNPERYKVGWPWLVELTSHK